MSIKFNRLAGNTYLSAPDNAALTYPTSAWTIGFVLTLDGEVNGDNPQYILSNAPYLAAGSLNITYQTAGNTTTPNKVVCFFDTDGTAYSAVTTHSSGSRLYILSCDGAGTISLSSTPVLATDPGTNGSVVQEFGATVAGALDGSAGLYIGARSDLAANRMLDNSLSRFFRLSGTLTSNEIGQLAYGKTPMDLGYTPEIYIGMNDATDTANTGSNGLTFTTSGTLATGTDPGFGYSAPTESVSPAGYASGRIFPRVGAAATLPITGTYTGTTPTSIEVQITDLNGVVVQAWTAVSGATISGGSYTATLSVPEGGMYRSQTRTKDAGGVVLATSAVSANMFGVGDLWACIGSSSAEKWFDASSGTTHTPDDRNSVYDEVNGWRPMSATGSASFIGSGMIAGANVPIGFLDMGEGGTTLAQWLNTAGAQWTKLSDAITATGDRLRGVISSMGSNDAAQGIVVSMAQHRTDLETLVNNIRTRTGIADLHVVISGTNSRADGLTEQYDYVREAEKLAGTNLNTLHVHTMDLELSGDGVHLTAAGFDDSCKRLGFVIGRLYSAGTYMKGPRITAINYEAGGTGIDLILEHRSGTDFTPATGITGIEASDGSGPLPVLSASRVDAGKIHVVVDRAISGTLVLTYMKGKQPNVTGAVRDNGSTPLAMDIELSMASTQVTANPPTGEPMAIPNKPAGPYTLDSANAYTAGATVYMMDTVQTDPLQRTPALGMTNTEGFYYTKGNVTLKTDDPHGVGLYRAGASPDNYIVISDNGNLDTVDPDAYNIPFTKLFVFRPDTAELTLFHSDGRDSGDFNYSNGGQLVRVTGGNLQFLKANNALIGGTDTVPITAGALCAGALSYDGSNLRLAVNGVDLGVVANAQSGFAISKVWLGQGAQSDSQDGILFFMMAHWNDAKNGAALASLTENPYQLIGVASTGGTADTTPPTLVNHTTNSAGDTLTLTFSESIEANSANSGGMVVVSGSHSVTAMTFAGTDAVLTLDPPLAPGEVASLTFTAPDPASYFGFRDASNNTAASFTIDPITNNAVSNPTGKPTLTGYVLMTLGDKAGAQPWADFGSEAEMTAWVNATDCRNLAQPVMIYNYLDRALDFSNVQTGPLGSDGAKYITFKPAPGRAYWELEPDSADGSWGTLGDTIEVNAITSWTTGMKFEGWRIHIPASVSGTETWRLRRNGWGQSGSESGMKYCKFLNESTLATFVTGEYGNYTMIEDCILLETNPAMNAKISTGGGGEVYRSTVSRTNASSTNPAFEGFAEIHSCVFSNCGATPYLGSGNFSDNFTNLATTSVGCTYVSQTMFETGVRPAAGTAIIGGGGSYAVSKNDANGNNRGTSPDAGAIQRTPALPLATGTLTKYEVDGASLLVAMNTAGTVDSASISIAAADTTSGAVSQGPFAMTLGAGTASYDINDIAPGNYTCTVLLTNAGGTNRVSGTSNFSIIGVGGGTVDPGTTTPATSVTLSGVITSAVAGSESAAMRLGLNGSNSGVITIGITDNDGGTFNPASPQIINGEGVSFTYTPASAGTKTLVFSNDGGLANPASIQVTVDAAQLPTPTVSIATVLNSILMGSRATLSGGLDFKGDAAGTIEVFYDPVPTGTPVKFTGAINVNGNTWTMQWQNLPVGEFRLRAVVTANGQTATAQTANLRIVGSTGVVNVPIA